MRYLATDSRTLLLAGDVMTGRGIDQVLPHPGDATLREPHVDSARTYVRMAEQVHGSVPTPVDPAYIWGDALTALERKTPAASVVNLETSITVSNAFWPDKVVHYRMHPDNIACLTTAHLDVCALANNHVLDFGQDGLLETLDVAPPEARLAQLRIVPTQMKRLRLTLASRADGTWLKETLERISHPFGTQFAQLDDGSLALRDPEAGGQLVR